MAWSAGIISHQTTQGRPIKNLLLFTFWQLLIPTAIFGLILLVLSFTPIVPSSDGKSFYLFILITLASGTVFGTIPCIAFTFLTQRTFTNSNFQTKSMIYWLLSFLFTMILWVPFSGGTEEGKLFFIGVYASIAAVCWNVLSKKYLFSP